jgi:hypothetical protein
VVANRLPRRMESKMTAGKIVSYTLGVPISETWVGTPLFDGTETVTMHLKRALDGVTAPPGNAPVIMSITPVYDAGLRGWTMTISAPVAASLAAGIYVTDARIVRTTGSVEYSDMLGIIMPERVTVL